MARKGRALAYLTATLTQGGNDAFIQTSIATALTGQTRTVYRLASMEIEWPPFINSAGNDAQLSLTRKSFSALATSMVLEKSMIFYRRRTNMYSTAVGNVVYSRTELVTWSDDDAPVIVEDPIYAQLDTSGTSATNVAYIRLGYWLDSITEVDRLQLIANSLS